MPRSSPPLLLLCLALAALPARAVPQSPAPTPAPAPAPSAAQAEMGDQLRRAASAGDAAKVRELLAAGADVNSANTYGATALAYACDKGHTEVVKLLLDKGANPNTKDTFYGQSPLAWAVSHGHAEAARALLAKGAEGEAEALALAAASNKPAVVQVILERGKVGAAALSEALAAAEAQPEGEGKDVAELLRKAGVQPPPEVKIDPAVLASYEGTYEAEGGGLKLILVLRDGKLKVEGGGGPPLTLVASDPQHFKAAEFPALKAAFDVQDGKVLGLTVEGAGPTTKLRKIATPEGSKP